MNTSYQILSINGFSEITVEFVEETELFHYEGNVDLCGYTEEECIERNALLN